MCHLIATAGPPGALASVFGGAGGTPPSLSAAVT
jgi:hypothetical protein